MKKIMKMATCLAIVAAFLLNCIPSYAVSYDLDCMITIMTFDDLAVGQDIDSVGLHSISDYSLMETGTISNVKWYADGIQTEPGDKFEERKDYTVTFNWDCKDSEQELTIPGEYGDSFCFFKTSSMLSSVGESYDYADYNPDASSTSNGWRDLTPGSKTKFVSFEIDAEEFTKQLSLYYFYEYPGTSEKVQVEPQDIFLKEDTSFNNIFIGTSPEDCYGIEFGDSFAIYQGEYVPLESLPSVESNCEYDLSFSYSATDLNPEKCLVYLDGKLLEYVDDVAKTDLFSPSEYTFEDDKIILKLNYTAYVDDSDDLVYSLVTPKVGDKSISIEVTGLSIPKVYQGTVIRGNFAKNEIWNHSMYMLYLSKGMSFGMYDSQTGMITFDSIVPFMGEPEEAEALEKCEYTLFLAPVLDADNMYMSYKNMKAITFTPTGNSNSEISISGMELDTSMLSWFYYAGENYGDVFLMDPNSVGYFNILNLDDTQPFFDDDNFEKTTKIDVTFLFVTEGKVDNLSLKKGEDSDYQELTLTKNKNLDFFYIDPSQDKEEYRNKYDRAIDAMGFMSDDHAAEVTDYYDNFTNCFNSVYMREWGTYGNIVRVTLDFSDPVISSGGSKTYKAANTDKTAEKISGSGKKGSKRTITPIEGKKVGRVTVTDKNGNKVEVTPNADGTYSFIQPASNVDVVVTYVNREITLTIGSTEADVDGERSNLDVSPVIRNDRTMLPIRFVAENLGAKVEWDEKHPEYVLITKGDIKIEITLGSDTMKVNGKEVKLDSVAFAENDRTYLPVRAVSENLNAIVEWNESKPMEVKIYER